MTIRRLVYLGQVTGADVRDTAVLRCEGKPVEAEAVFELLRRRSPWRESRQHVRVIVGSHPGRADILMEGDRIFPEHARFYFPKDTGGPLDLMVIHEDSTHLNGEPAPAHQWLTLEGGEEIDFGPWRWRYEMES